MCPIVFCVVLLISDVLLVLVMDMNIVVEEVMEESKSGLLPRVPARRPETSLVLPRARSRDTLGPRDNDIGDIVRDGGWTCSPGGCSKKNAEGWAGVEEIDAFSRKRDAQ